MLEKLAEMYAQVAEPRGIPWDGLVAKGHGITENGYDPAYMQIMLDESFKFFDVLGGLSQDFRDKYRTIRASDARSAMTQVLALINQTGADVWQATKAGDWDAAVHFPRSVAVDALATLAASAVNGAFLHYDGVMEAAMLAGKVTPEEVMTHAQSVVQTFQTFVDLGKNGDLDDFKKDVPAPVAGMGALPLLAGWALAALGIAVVLGLAYLLYVLKVASPIQNKVMEYCDKLAKSGNPEDIRTCVAALQSMEKNGNPDLLGFLGDAVKPIITVLAIGAVIYIGALILPGILARRKAAA